MIYLPMVGVYYLSLGYHERILMSTPNPTIVRKITHVLHEEYTLTPCFYS